MAALITGGGWTAAAGPWIWILSLVCVGLPHGAADLAIARSLARRGDRPLLAGMLAYAAGMAGVAALFAVAPRLAIAAFSVVSIWHFGCGHAGTEPAAGDDTGPGRSRRAGLAWTAVAATARAAVVLGMPAVCHPVETAAVADRLVGLLRAGGPSAAPLFDPASVRIGGLVFLAAAVAAIVVEAVACRGRGLGWTLAETSVFALCGYAADPLFSVGAYYLVWHAWRHMEAIMRVLEGREPEGIGPLLRAVGRIHLQALPLLVPTWAALAAAFWMLSPGHSARDLAILSIGVYLVVTPSHDVLVHRMENAQSRA